MPGSKPRYRSGNKVLVNTGSLENIQGLVLEVDKTQPRLLKYFVAVEGISYPIWVYGRELKPCSQG
jgi:ribosomal protein L24